MALPAPTASVDAQLLAGVLSEIAEISSETFELQDVFGRVATSVRRVIPFDHMGVVRILDGEWAVKHATTFAIECAEAADTNRAAHANGGSDGRQEEPACSQPCPLTTWSPRIRPRPEPIPRIDDATIELDASFRGDADILAGGVRSTLWEPFRTGDRFGGGVWLCSYTPYAFTNEHQEVLRPIAALLGSAVEHWRIWDAERRRQERLDKIETLLGTLAAALDVRDVFGRLSEEMQPILPHDMMVLTELDMRARTIQVIASASRDDCAVPTGPVQLTDRELAQRIDFEILRDIQTELPTETERQHLILSSGMRSWMRVPVWVSGEIRGGLSFFHGEPSRFSLEDVEVVRRLADRIALTLSLRRLAEEERIAAEERERAERLAATVETLTREVESLGRGRIAGVSPGWKQALLEVGRVASSETTVLITGESGTGKEVISRLLHQGSGRANQPFIAINCAALPEQLLESELFGYEKGAFTGAVAAKVGRIEQAAGGTLFLDEIAEMSPLVQAKFLRVLEEREFQRLGGTRTLKANVRVLAATNRDLAASMARGAFREDLYYRLNVFQIHIPSLRDRPEDILPLAHTFLEDLGRSMGRPAAGISRDARDWLLDYGWPGNVRELRNAIERAILLCDGGLIARDHLPKPMPPFVAPRSRAGNGSSAPAKSFPSDGVNLDAMERDLVKQALDQAKGNKSRAARLLGLTRAQLYSRIEKHGIA